MALNSNEVVDFRIIFSPVCPQSAMELYRNNLLTWLDKIPQLNAFASLICQKHSAFAAPRLEKFSRRNPPSYYWTIPIDPAY